MGLSQRGVTGAISTTNEPLIRSQKMLQGRERERERQGERERERERERRRERSRWWGTKETIVSYKSWEKAVFQFQP